MHDRAAEHPDVVADLAADHQRRADRCGVLPREQALALALALDERRGRALPQ